MAVLSKAVWHEAAGTTALAVTDTKLCVSDHVSLSKYLSVTVKVRGVHVVGEIVISYKGRGVVRVDIWTAAVALLGRVSAVFTLVNVLIYPLLLVNQKPGHGSDSHCEDLASVPGQFM
jgi:hypothetical protein